MTGLLTVVLGRSSVERASSHAVGDWRWSASDSASDCDCDCGQSSCRGSQSWIEWGCFLAAMPRGWVNKPLNASNGSYQMWCL